MLLYPMALKLAGKHCVVVGGGIIAGRKVRPLLECGARVTLVSPEVTANLLRMAEEGTIAWERRCFEPADVLGALLVIAATNLRTVNEAVYQAGQENGVLVNVVDVPDLCDFYVPASLRRGPLQITVSTGGVCPALARNVRKKLQQHVGPEYLPLVEMGGRLRTALLEQVPDADQRKWALEHFFATNVLELLKTDRVDEAEALCREALRRAVENDYEAGV